MDTVLCDANWGFGIVIMSSKRERKTVISLFLCECTRYGWDITCLERRTELYLVAERVGDLFFSFRDPVWLNWWPPLTGNVRLCVCDRSETCSSSRLNISSSSASFRDSFVCSGAAILRLYLVSFEGSPRPSAIPVTSNWISSCTAYRTREYYEKSYRIQFKHTLSGSSRRNFRSQIAHGIIVRNLK